LAFLAIFAQIGAGTKLFDDLRCPDRTTLRSDYVKNNFELSMFEGFYYELATKDITQPHLCACTTSNKTVTDNGQHIYDDFVLQCPDVPGMRTKYPSPLSFNVTEIPGVLDGKWNVPVLNMLTFPDTVVRRRNRSNNFEQHYPDMDSSLFCLLRLMSAWARLNTAGFSNFNASKS
jgi:hypothetical protein